VPDRAKQPAQGPDRYLAADLPPSRAQLHSIAVLAGQLLGFQLDTRYDATVALVRLQMAVRDQDPPADPPSTF
jgi:hypothetical protein